MGFVWNRLLSNNAQGFQDNKSQKIHTCLKTIYSVRIRLWISITWFQQKVSVNKIRISRFHNVKELHWKHLMNYKNIMSFVVIRSMFYAYLCKIFWYYLRALPLEGKTTTEYKHKSEEENWNFERGWLCNI